MQRQLAVNSCSFTDHVCGQVVIVKAQPKLATSLI